jgi:hypothetical protein
MESRGRKGQSFGSRRKRNQKTVKYIGRESTLEIHPQIVGYESFLYVARAHSVPAVPSDIEQ